MDSPLAFRQGRETATNINQSISEHQDQSAIDQILSRALQSNDPEVMRQSFTQLLSTVSQERQPQAIKLLQDRAQQIQQNTQSGLFAKAQAGTATEDELSKLHPKSAIELEKAKNRTPAGGTTSQSVPPQVVQAMDRVIKANPDADAAELQQQMHEAGVPPIYSNGYIETKRRQNDTSKKIDAADIRLNRQETLPVKQEIINRGNTAKESIRTKQELDRLIDTKKLDNPTFAVIADAMPFNLGKRMLSPETVVYKAGMVDEFKDLKNIFTGQTRTAELNILQNKMADTYLTDAQKKAILKSRIDVLNRDVYRMEAAEQVDPSLGLFEFNKKVGELTQKRIDALGDKVIADHRAIIEEAERQKKIPLSPSDPAGLEILQQILQEANGDKKLARKMARDKGYTIGPRDDR